jgi:hypothetical protein
VATTDPLGNLSGADTPGEVHTIEAGLRERYPLDGAVFTGLWVTPGG